ncbi:MAG: carboxy-S-adenosyl-L-methionine synthase CmoA [Verrucomicrobiota bacterium]|nr:carboxy-S-adenosyl-L-methionine synthase CmoA [Verrucomicrobiota bacterium]
MNKDLLYSKPLPLVSDFKFNNSVVNVFSDMINRSVPGYKTTLNLINILTSIHFNNKTNVYDIGCSLGDSSAASIEGIINKDFHFFAIDTSKEMINECKKNLLKKYPHKNIIFINKDALKIKFENASIIIFNFTLQFIPIDQRKNLLDRIYKGMNKNGILILSEKILFDDHDTQTNKNILHDKFKSINGYSNLEINQKKDALKKILLSETLNDHILRLQEIGYKNISVIYQCINFSTVVAFK